MYVFMYKHSSKQADQHNTRLASRSRVKILPFLAIVADYQLGDMNKSPHKKFEKKYRKKSYSKSLPHHKVYNRKASIQTGLTRVYRVEFRLRRLCAFVFRSYVISIIPGLQTQDE